MKKAIALCFMMLGGYGLNANALSPSSIILPQAMEVAPPNGFAGYDEKTGVGTTGGLKASNNMIFLVNNKKDLLEAITINKGKPRIIQIAGIIDISENRPYQNFDDQKSRSLIKIPSNTTLIGIDNNAGFIHGSLILSKVNNVIIRNISIEAPVDVAPQFEEGDGWNAEWDGINVIESTYIWIDHVSFSDGSFTDDRYTQKDGWKYVQHDGLLDIKRGSDFITISYCLFENHDKTILIGHNDKNNAQDENKLHITFHHNLFNNLRQRTPRIRFGKVHMYNNIFTGTVQKSTTIYPYLYSVGLGVKSSVVSESNLFLIQGLVDSCKIVKEFGNNNIRDSKSIFNDSPLDWSTCNFNNNINWSIPYQYSTDDIHNNSVNYQQDIGSGKL